MDEDLPSEFDLIVIGTGLSESIVAAAASRIGKTVLHLDVNAYYGGYWASFDLKSLINYAERKSEDRNYKISDNVLEVNNNPEIENVHIEWNDPEPTEGVENEPNDWNKQKILDVHRKFNIDLSPKLLYSRGELVELLISSNICRYAEFRSNDRILTLINDKLITVPCSRSDVFTNKDVTVVEKRLLMKFLNTCVPGATADEVVAPIDTENKTFVQYLREFKLTDNLIHYILYSIAMGNENISCKEGIENVTQFLNSIGRYGNTPFLFPMYGCGEIAQCFCRLCAVFGGIYCLRRPYKQITFNGSDNKLEFSTIQCGNQSINSKNIVIGNGNISSGIVLNKESAPNAIPQRKCGKLSRAVIITTAPLTGVLPDKDSGGVTFLKLPGENNDAGVFVVQLSHLTGTCPKGLYLVHLTGEQILDAKTDLNPYVNKLFKTKADAGNEDSSKERVKPEILFAIYFNIPSCLKCSLNTDNLPGGMNLTCGPFYELDFDYSIDEARKMFAQIYPNDEFLPRAPDPEEIIMGDEDATEVKLDDDELLTAAKESENSAESPAKEKTDSTKEEISNTENAD